MNFGSHLVDFRLAKRLLLVLINVACFSLFYLAVVCLETRLCVAKRTWMAVDPVLQQFCFWLYSVGLINVACFSLFYLAVVCLETRLCVAKRTWMAVDPVLQQFCFWLYSVGFICMLWITMAFNSYESSSTHRHWKGSIELNGSKMCCTHPHRYPATHRRMYCI